MKKLISNIAIIIALVVTSLSYSNAQQYLKIYDTINTVSPNFKIALEGDIYGYTQISSDMNTIHYEYLNSDRNII